MNGLTTAVDTVALGMEWLRLEVARSRVDRAKDRHLALLAWALPPSSNTGVHRPLSFLRYGPKFGWRIDAFCSSPPSNQSEHGEYLTKLVPPESRIHIVRDPTRVPSYTLFPRVDGGFRLALSYARTAIATLNFDPPSAVIASGPPFFAFVAALFVARHFRIPLILDYRDEWTECPADFVDKSGNDLWWERRCLRSAAQVIYATSGLREHALKIFPELSPSRTHHIANGWEPDNFLDLPVVKSPAQSSHDEIFRIAHVGILVQHTPPEPLLESLAALVAEQPESRNRLRLQLIGRRSPAADAALRAFPHQQMLEIVDHVSKLDAVHYMHEANALLVISMPDMARAMPSKLIEYLAARKPILVFGADGDPADLVERLGVGALCRAGSGEALKNAIDRLARVSYERSSREVDAWLDSHRREILAARLFDLLDKTVLDVKT